ncbi:Pycsar system effector family protein [Streptomyces sp. NPDC005336]|uniref:Pycsar system effector family protein n=1 Tax=Streptomyces sp. NPDC005336 TaxID=3157035 RepID=UPI0033A91C07
MSEATPGDAVAVNVVVEKKLAGRSAEMFVEVQRADAKAAALCAVAGGLLAVVGAALAALAHGAHLSSAVLGCSCVLLSAALVTALLAIRPVLPHGSALTGLERARAGATAEDVMAALQAMSSGDRVRVEADRLSLRASLARRKYRAIKASVDLLITAIIVTGIGLLITYAES